MIAYPLGSSSPNDGSPGESSRLLLVAQTDHAAFAAELLSLWRTDGLPENPRRRQLIRGTRDHDNGWAEADSAPRRRRSGRPHDFRSLPDDLRLEIWHRGVRRKVESDPEAAVYVVRHALELHRSDAGAAEWDQALVDWRLLEDELRERVRISAEELAADYRFVALADTLSLAACLRWSDPVERAGTSMHTESEGDLAVTLHLDPFPLAGATTFRIRGRIIPDRLYTGDADLAVEMASARWQDLTVRVVP